MARWGWEVKEGISRAEPQGISKLGSVQRPEARIWGGCRGLGWQVGRARFELPGNCIFRPLKASEQKKDTIWRERFRSVSGCSVVTDNGEQGGNKESRRLGPGRKGEKWEHALGYTFCLPVIGCERWEKKRQQLFQGFWCEAYWNSTFATPSIKPPIYRPKQGWAVVQW